MEMLSSIQTLGMALLAAFLFILLSFALSVFWILPLRMKFKLKRSGFNGPPPIFPFGNLNEMRKKGKKDTPSQVCSITHDIHPLVFPYFAQWRKSYGKVFIYWLGTEPFLHVADPEFLKQVTSGALSKKWGKPNVFRRERKALFGDGLVMAEGDDWARKRQAISTILSTTNLNGMINLVVESTSKMLDNWNYHLCTTNNEINVVKDISRNAAEIITKISFGMSLTNSKLISDKIQRLLTVLFRPNRLVGVPVSSLLNLKHTYQVKKLGEEVDQLLTSIIESRLKEEGSSHNSHSDFLGFLLERKFSSRELLDECKTFFVGGYETTVLVVTWALFLLALHPEWQQMLREELKKTNGKEPLDFISLSKLTKMEWVLNEVLRLYPSAPNVQRQAKEDICAEGIVIPKGTNMWIDIVGPHHDSTLWGDDVNEFKPERFKESLYGGSKHRMGFLPFGIGARTCVGKSLSMMECKVVLSLILGKYSMSISPAYSHSQVIFTLKPAHGLPLLFQSLDESR